MPFSAQQKLDLAAPLNQSHVKKRTNYGGGGQLSYIEGWHAIAEANRIFGFDGWNRETDLTPLGEPQLIKDKNGNDQWRVRYMAKSIIRVGQVIREGVGYGDGAARDVGAAYELAIKEAETDAMKRALMTFGNPFGLALYDKDQKQVGDDDQISAYKARQDGSYPEMEKDIRACQCEDELNAWLDDNKDKIAKFPNNWKDHLREEVKRKKKELIQAQDDLVIEKGLGDPQKFLDDIEGQMNSAPNVEILDEILDEFKSAENNFSFLVDEGQRISKAYDDNKIRLSEAA